MTTPKRSDADKQTDDAPRNENAPARALTNELILAAFQGRASDIHLDPTEDGKGRIRLRIDGALNDYEPKTHAPFAEVVNCFKLMAATNVEEKRLPQDGRIMLNIKERKLDLRVSCVPTVFGERVTLRILDRQATLVTLEQIFPADELPPVERLRDLSHGLIICAGPTGSGKTTLLYAMIMSMDRDKRNVLSIEDPVEYTLDGVAQIQIRSNIGLTFARAIRSMLRQDPDVILVGELRDLEALQLAIQSALTGHLVMTTLHTNDAPGTVQRMLDIGVEPFLVNAVLEGVIAQRLVRTLCADCRKPAEPKLALLPPDAAAFVKAATDAEFCAPVGCGKCRGLGYRGRAAVHEILEPDDAVRAAVAEGAGPERMRQAALAAGMEPMLINGLRKAAKGLTSIQEALRVLH